MGQLSQFINGKPGHFREGEEGNFPWKDTGNHVWYVLITMENGGLQHYGFTASVSNKEGLLRALKSMAKDESGLLFGVWTGQYRTDLFVLDRNQAMKRLEESLK
jgi:hypothetical protein